MGTEIADVMVLGAGLCGLTMAWKLQEAGLQTTVIEKQPQVGGLAKSVVWGDFRFDVGPSAFSTQEQPVQRNLLALMGRESEIPMRAHRIRFQDRWIDYPLSFQSLLQIPTGTMARAMGEYFVLWGRHRKGAKPSRKKPVPQSPFPRYGDVIDQLIMSNYLQKIRRHPSVSLRPSWAILESNSHAPLEALRQSLRGLFAVPHTHTTTFHDPAEGFGSIAETLKRKIESLGGVVHTEATLRRISAPDGEVRSVDFYHNGRECTQETDYVMSTIPVPALLTLLDPLPEHALIESSLQLRHHVMTFLCVLLDRPPTEDVIEKGWSYFPDPDIPFFRVSHAQPHTTQGLKRADRTCLVIEWMMSPHHPHAQASPQELYEAALPGLQAAGFATTPVIDLMVHRERQAVPAFTDKAQQTMRQISAYLTRVRRIRSLGQRGTFTPSHLSQTLHDAFRAANDLTHEAERLRRASARSTA